MSSPCIKVILPLTTHSSKIRVKKRKDIFYQGVPLATRQEKITNDCYFEWQISYDLKETNRNFDKFHKTTLNKIKIVRKGFVNLNHVEKLLKEVKEENKFIEDELEVCRTQPKEYKFGK